MAIERNQQHLNYEYLYKEEFADKPTLVLIHGLMGDLNNLGMIARYYSNRFNVLKVDYINHGRSFYRDVMDYHEMASEVMKIVNSLGIKKILPIGHSMGGKGAMRVAFNYPESCVGLVVLDMAPVQYTQRGHDDIFRALKMVRDAKVTSSKEAKDILSSVLTDQGIVMFLMKSFTLEEEHRFLFNAPVLEAEYMHIGIWEEGLFNKASAFIYGANSLYVSEERAKAIPPQFPKCKFYRVENASHWLHAEQPKTVFAYIDDYLENIGLLGSFNNYY